MMQQCFEFPDINRTLVPNIIFPGCLVKEIWSLPKTGICCFSIMIKVKKKHLNITMYNIDVGGVNGIVTLANKVTLIEDWDHFSNDNFTVLDALIG